MKSSKVRSGDKVGQFCILPSLIDWSENCSFRYSLTCLLKQGVPHYAESAVLTVFHVCLNLLEFLTLTAS